MSSIAYVTENETTANENNTPKHKSKHSDCKFIFYVLNFTFHFSALL